MQDLSPWLTPALLVGLFVWLRLDPRLAPRVERSHRRHRRGLHQRFDDVNQRFGEVNKRFDGVYRQLADLRECVAKLEGFLAGRRDRDAA